MLDLLGHGIQFDAVIHGDMGSLTLSRSREPGPRALVTGCNPSDANHHKNDPTSSPKVCRELVESIEAGRYDISDDLWIDHVVEEIQTSEGPYPDLVLGQNWIRCSEASAGTRQAQGGVGRKTLDLEGCIVTDGTIPAVSGYKVKRNVEQPTSDDDSRGTGRAIPAQSAGGEALRPPERSCYMPLLHAQQAQELYSASSFLRDQG